MRVLFLDVDGVLNRTGYKPGSSAGLRSWIEPELARRLSKVIAATGASLVMSSDWRRGRALPLLQEELGAAGIVGSLIDVTPVLGEQRWREIDSWMKTHEVAPASVVIVDDGYDMGGLAARFVRTSPLNGLDVDAARAIVGLFEDADA